MDKIMMDYDGYHTNGKEIKKGSIPNEKMSGELGPIFPHVTLPPL